MKSSHLKPFIMIICGFIKPSYMIFLSGNVKFLEMKIGKIPYITTLCNLISHTKTVYDLWYRPNYKIITENVLKVFPKGPQKRKKRVFENCVF